MVKFLLWHEVKRNLRPMRVLPLLGVAMVLAHREVGHFMQPATAQVQGALTLHGFWLTVVIPLVAGAVAGTLAEDRRKGHTLLVLSKGVSRGQYLLSKLLGTAASSALVLVLVLAGFYVIVASLWPPGRVTWRMDDVRWPIGVANALYKQNPLAHDMLVASIYIVTAASLSLVGVLAGAIVANEYVAMASPPLFTVLATVVFREVWELLSPEHYLSLSYIRDVPVWLRPYGAFLYWLGLAAVVSVLARWIFSKRELT